MTWSLIITHKKNMLSTNIKTRIVILSDDREIAITETQYNAIKADQSLWKYSDPILIKDPDTKKVLFDWKIWAIKEFREIEHINIHWLWYYCDFWNFHTVNSNCDCNIKYSMSPYVFKSKVFEKFPNVNYNSQITHSMRLMILWKSEK